MDHTYGLERNLRRGWALIRTNTRAGRATLGSAGLEPPAGAARYSHARHRKGLLRRLRQRASQNTVPTRHAEGFFVCRLAVGWSTTGPLSPPWQCPAVCLCASEASAVENLATHARTTELVSLICSFILDRVRGPARIPLSMDHQQPKRHMGVSLIGYGHEACTACSYRPMQHMRVGTPCCLLIPYRIREASLLPRFAQSWEDTCSEI